MTRISDTIVVRTLRRKLNLPKPRERILCRFVAGSVSKVAQSIMNKFNYKVFGMRTPWNNKLVLNFLCRKASSHSVSSSSNSIIIFTACIVFIICAVYVTKDMDFIDTYMM